jgi:ribosomal protein L11 methylase PrmA
MISTTERNSASFRDPSGFVFRRKGEYYRQVNTVYGPEYDQLMSSGLYKQLTEARLLIPHEVESDAEIAPDSSAYRILHPEQLDFISYPYEWCFSQLKDAALLTLQVQRLAMARGLSLKDASAYNVQFHRGRPLFIDTLSFEHYDEAKPWVAYRQFCQHFLAPLALMAHTDLSLSQLLRVHIDGVPLPLASKLLPWWTRWTIGLGMHIHLHARTQMKYANANHAIHQTKRQFGRRNLEALLASLEQTVRKLNWRGGQTEWSNYYASNNNYGNDGMESKSRLVREMLESNRPDMVWDLGANTGRFSKIAAEAGARTVVAWDVDPACVEANYCHALQRQEHMIIPLLLDLTNPSPGLGWANAERMSLSQRGPASIAMALGLIHHMTISNNVPLANVAAFLGDICHRLIIEWVPKEDSQVQRLLLSRKDVFRDYTQAAFEQVFGEFFKIERVSPVNGTRRTLYVMKSD